MDGNHSCMSLKIKKSSLSSFNNRGNVVDEMRYYIPLRIRSVWVQINLIKTGSENAFTKFICNRDTLEYCPQQSSCLQSLIQFMIALKLVWHRRGLLKFQCNDIVEEEILFHKFKMSLFITKTKTGKVQFIFCTITL